MSNKIGREKVCNISDDTTIHSLAKDATVTCGRCGMKANDPVNVCDPVQIPEAGWLGD